MDYGLHRVLAATYVAIFILASLISVEARVNTFSTEAEDVKLGKILAVKTIKTEYGSIYDCVDIYKQPALHHPLLKGHKIQVRPSFAVKKRPSNISRLASARSSLEDQCPKGTVPIRRITKEERLKAESSFNFHVKASASGFEFAGLSTLQDKSKKFQGAGGYISIFHPLAEKGQFSSTMISVESGPDELFSSIRVGWMVNPNLYGDTLTRLYTVWGQGGNGTTHGCFNTNCPGFIIVNSKIHLDHPFNSLSDPEYSYYVKLYITQDTVTGNWWLEHGEAETRNADTEPQQIGYWPSSLFTNIKDGAQILRWGGMVYSDKPKSPPMGNGGTDCHFRRITLAGSGDVSRTPLEATESRCYKVRENSYKDEYWGYSFWFGGPGGDTSECD